MWSYHWLLTFNRCRRDLQHPPTLPSCDVPSITARALFQLGGDDAEALDNGDER